MPFRPVNIPQQEQQQGGFRPVDMTPLDPSVNSLGIESKPLLGDEPKSLDFKRGFSEVGRQFSGLAGRIGQSTASTFQEARGIAGEASQKFRQGEFFEGAGKTFAAGTKALFSPLTGLTGGIIQPAVEDVTEKLKKELSESDKNKLKSLFTKAIKFKKGLPSEVQTLLQVGGAALEIVGTLEGGKIVSEISTSAGKQLAKAGSKGAKITGKALDKGGKIVEEATDKVGEKIGRVIPIPGSPKAVSSAESIVSSVQKVNPKKAQDFEKMTGQSVGQWLTDRNIIGTRNQTIDKLSRRWIQAKNRLDTGIEALSFEGTGTGKVLLKNDIIPEILEEIIQRQSRVKGRGIEGSGRFKALLEKHESQGLTPKEIIEIKRFYERKVKVGYLKDQNSELVERATNQDSELREFLISEMEERGFIQFREMSKEIQQSKFLVDAIAGKLTGQQANNKFGLTDNLLLAGSVINPKILAGLITKKIITSEKVLSGLSRVLRGDIPIKKLPDLALESILKSRTPLLQEGAIPLRSKEVADFFLRESIKQLPSPKAGQLPVEFPVITPPSPFSRRKSQ